MHIREARDCWARDIGTINADNSVLVSRKLLGLGWQWHLCHRCGSEGAKELRVPGAGLPRLSPPPPVGTRSRSALQAPAAVAGPELVSHLLGATAACLAACRLHRHHGQGCEDRI